MRNCPYSTRVSDFLPITEPQMQTIVLGLKFSLGAFFFREIFSVVIYWDSSLFELNRVMQRLEETSHESQLLKTESTSLPFFLGFGVKSEYNH